MRQWISDELELPTIKARMMEMPSLSEVRKAAINTFDADFATMCQRLDVDGFSSTTNLQQVQARTQINMVGWNQDEYQDQKNVLGLAQDARQTTPFNKYSNHNHQGGKGWKRKNNWSKGDHEPNYQRNTWRRKGGKGGKGGKVITSLSNHQNRQDRLELPCTWQACQGKPTHSRRECPEWAKKQCKRPNCHMGDQPHSNQQCRISKEQVNAQPEPQNQQRRYNDHTHKQRRNRHQLNYVESNQLLAQQMEENYQRMQHQQFQASATNQEPQVQLVSSNQRQ
jgi:hypothetical protein